jgi:hypothetical protein
MIIALCGRMGVGKDFVLNNYIIPFLQSKRRDFIKLSFADQLKVNLMVTHNLTYNELYETKTNESRTLLQREGTENGRMVLGEDIWIRYFNAWKTVLDNRGVYDYIISDCRFKNEIDWVKKNGGIVIKVVANKRNIYRINQECNNIRNTTHPSETDLDSLDNSFYDIVINNDYDDIINKYSLYEKLDNLVN